MHMMFLMAADLGNFGVEFWVGIAGLLIAAVGAVGAILQAMQGKKYKLMTHETLSDIAIINGKKDLGQEVKLTLDGHIANDIRLVYLKLTNAGKATISRDDYELPEFNQPKPTTEKALLLDFGEHKIIRFAIHGVDPEGLIPRNMLNQLLLKVASNQLKFYGIGLSSKNAVFVKVLCLKDALSGMTTQLASLSDKDREVKVTVVGQIKDGEIKEYIPTPPRITPGRIKIGGLILLAVIGFLISFNVLGVGPLIQGQCGISSIKDSGSTAFYSTASQEAQAYPTCVLGSIDVSESNSQDGLMSLESRKIQIANSELRSSYPDLQDHPIAGIVFALIVNKDVNITNLSSFQIQNIYNGSYKNWNKIDPSMQNLPITVLERPSGSGTLAALIKYVLDGKTPQPTATINVPDNTMDVVNQVTSTPGAIGYVALSAAIANGAVSILNIDKQAPGAATVESGQYKFWAIEHMYTTQNPDQPVSSFINFVSKNLQTGATFIRLSDILPSIQKTR